MQQEEFICFDCETTGLDTKQDRIVEVACVRFTLTEVLEEFQTLINPDRIIPPSTIAIHHITDDMVKDQPQFKEIAPKLLSMIGRSTLVGHGIKFDIDVVANSCEREGIQCTLTNNIYIDTLRMARLYGDSPCNSLRDLGKHFNIETEGAHRAMNDVMINIKVFRYLAKNYKSLTQLLKILSYPIKMRTMPLGKHKGRPFKDIPLNYLYWALKKDFDEDLIFSIRSEIKRRKSGGVFGLETNPFKEL